MYVYGEKMQYNIPEIDPNTAKIWLDAQEAILVDVRELSEYQDARIANTTLIPLGTITADKLPILKEGQKIVVNCARGARSAKAIQLIKLEDPALPLYNLTGGICEWIQLGLPVIRGK